MTDKTQVEELREFASNMRGPLAETRRQLCEGAATTLAQQQVALQLAEQALKVESESLADVIKMVTDKDSEVPNVWTNRLKKVQAAIKAAKEFKSHQPPDLSQDQE